MSTATTHIKTDKQLVPALRFKEFDGEWGSKQLKEITSYVDYRGRGPEKSEQGIFLVTAKNIKKGFINYECSKEYVPTENRSIVMSKGLPEVGDILFTTEAPLGNVAQVDNSDIALAQRVIKFRGKRELLNDYLLHFMIGPIYQKLITRKAIGTTVLGISGKELHKTNIQFPSPPEQQKIASFLSAVDNKIQQLTAKKNLLEQYKKGVMQQLFSGQLRFKDENGNPYPDWEEKRLKDITKINQGLQIAISERFLEPVEDGYFYITNEFLRAKSDMTYFIKSPPESVICTEDDILMTRTGNTGQVVTGVNGAFHNNFFKIKYQEHCEKWFLYYFLTSPLTQHTILKLAGTSTIPDINHGDFYKIKIELPSIKEQTKISTVVKSIDAKIESVNNQITQTQTFKKGLLQQMFV